MYFFLFIIKHNPTCNPNCQWDVSRSDNNVFNCMNELATSLLKCKIVMKLPFEYDGSSKDCSGMCGNFSLLQYCLLEWLMVKYCYSHVKT